MKGYEPIFRQGRLIAVVFRSYLAVTGLKFFTDKDNPFQIGIHQRVKGVRLSPHIHKLETPIVIKTIQEILFVLKGKIRVVFYSNTGKLFSKKILKIGDCVLFMNEGHGVDFLEDSKVLEVKQGPYPGSESAKIYIKNPTK